MSSGRWDGEAVIFLGGGGEAPPGYERRRSGHGTARQSLSHQQRHRPRGPGRAPRAHNRARTRPAQASHTALLAAFGGYAKLAPADFSGRPAVRLLAYLILAIAGAVLAPLRLGAEAPR